MSRFSPTPLSIAASSQVRADLAGRVYRLSFPPQLEATAWARQAPGARWDPQRRVCLLPAGDAERVRTTLERIAQALARRTGRAQDDVVQDDEAEESRTLVRDGQALVGQRIQTPLGWALIESHGPAFRGGERLRREGRPDLVGVALRWAYCRPCDQKAA